MTHSCGPKFLAGWIHIPEWHSHETCRRHDATYKRGGTATDRAKADRELLNGMLRDAATRTRWQQPWYRLQAWHYYAWVRAFGWMSFHYTRPENV